MVVRYVDLVSFLVVVDLACQVVDHALESLALQGLVLQDLVLQDLVHQGLALQGLAQVQGLGLETLEEVLY